jgi:hypothetical protein
MKPIAKLSRQGGAFIVEFALVALFFFVFVFTLLEISRAVYVFNTLQEVTRRAARSASVTDLADGVAMSKLKYDAVFDPVNGTLALAAPVTHAYIKIDYLSLQNGAGGSITPTVIPTASLPNCPARNRVTCSADSGDASCVRLVRVRICGPGAGDCAPVPYETLLPLVSLPVNLPTSTTIVKAESLGYTPGSPMCN